MLNLFWSKKKSQGNEFCCIDQMTCLHLAKDLDKAWKEASLHVKGSPCTSLDGCQIGWS